MIVFDHNKHQIEECKELSKHLGFKKFHFRYTDRRDVIVKDRAGKYAYEIRAVKKDNTLRNPNSLSKQEVFQDLQRSKNAEIRMLTDSYKPSFDIDNVKPLENLNNCESLRDSSIYIAANWAVVPCCFIGSIFINKHQDHRYNNFIENMTAAGIDEKSYIATGQATIKDIVTDVGFDWIYNSLLSNPLKTCYASCHNGDSRYKEMWNENTTIELFERR